MVTSVRARLTPFQIGLFAMPPATSCRNVIFAAFEIGFRERTQSIHLRPEV